MKIHDSYSGLQARNQHAAAARFDDAFSTLLQRNLEHCFESLQRKRADLSQPAQRRSFAKAQIGKFATAGECTRSVDRATARVGCKSDLFVNQAWRIRLGIMLNKKV